LLISAECTDMKSINRPASYRYIHSEVLISTRQR